MRTSPTRKNAGAHLLRKAIKLTLQDPDNKVYRAFTDRLLEIYREACRVQRDQRLNDAEEHEKSRPSTKRFSNCAERCGVRSCRNFKGQKMIIVY